MCQKTDSVHFLCMRCCYIVERVLYRRLIVNNDIFLFKKFLPRYKYLRLHNRQLIDMSCVMSVGKPAINAFIC